MTAATVLVRLAPALRALFPGAPGELELAAADVAALIEELEARWPGMADRLRDSRPAVRRHINIFVEGRRARLDTPLAPGSAVDIITAVSGG